MWQSVHHSFTSIMLELLSFTGLITKGFHNSFAAVTETKCQQPAESWCVWQVHCFLNTDLIKMLCPVNCLWEQHKFNNILLCEIYWTIHSVEWCLCRHKKAVFTFIVESVAEIFSELSENLILRGGPMSMIFDITKSLGASPVWIFSIHRCDVETLKPPVHKQWEWTLHWSRIHPVSCR